ncbi:hypothetical protein PAXINDRAFT_21994 [Paxillus involutus ATCC 200175]|uniref:Uncharacterized protein n=1 Tax=Paxillus involutus ATCC 200175 TaxID=664439 RepID=A0A0C9SZX7_PAXIN|nr:hypothetical protein PAXINDRAFT_21994 [Paxillus involutus ATCC 200175]
MAYLCAPDMNTPVTVPLASVGVAVQPLTQGTANEVKSCLGRLQGLPAVLQGDWDNVKATCFQSSYKDQGRVLHTPFTAVFDAKKKFTDNKSQMHTRPASSLKTGDIILIEAWIRRYPSAKETRDQMDKGWKTWKVKLELKAVSIVHEKLQLTDSNT